MSGLVPRANGKGRVVALEIMLANSAIRNQIRVNDLAQISSTIMTSKDEGMQTLELAFKNLISQNIITLEEAMSHTRNIEALKRLVAR